MLTHLYHCILRNWQPAQNHHDSTSAACTSLSTIIMILITWWDRLHWYTACAQVWYERQSHETRLLLKSGLVLLLLYVAMGGRFGLTNMVAPTTSSPYSHSASNSNCYQGDHGQGNAYEQYYHRTHHLGKEKDSKKY